MTMKLKKTGIALLSAMLVLGNVTPVMATQTAGTQQTTQTQSKTDTLQKEKEDAVRDRGLRQYYKAEDRCGNRKKDR